VLHVAVALHLIQLHVTHATFYRGCFLAFPFCAYTRVQFLVSGEVSFGENAGRRASLENSLV
jgi:hypothetical protein